MFSKMNQMWFVHPGYTPPWPLKIEVLPNHAARVTGYKFGSYVTGHGEHYWDKISEVIRMGFVPVDIAKDLNLLDIDWEPPDERDLDCKIKECFYKLKK
jgi:hypothetical protein